MDKRLISLLILFFVGSGWLFSLDTKLTLSGQIFRHNPEGNAPDYQVGAEVFLVRLGNDNNITEKYGPALTNAEGLYGFYDIDTFDIVKNYYLVVLVRKEKVWEQLLNASNMVFSNSTWNIRNVVLGRDATQ